MTYISFKKSHNVKYANSLQRLAIAPSTPQNPSPDFFKILRVLTFKTLGDAEFERELEGKELGIYSVLNVVRVDGSAWEVVVHKDAVVRFVEGFIVEDYTRPQEPSEAQIRVQGALVARNKAQKAYINRARQCRPETQKVYQAYIEKVERDRSKDFDFLMENPEASVMTPTWGDLVEGKSSKL